LAVFLLCQKQHTLFSLDAVSHFLEFPSRVVCHRLSAILLIRHPFFFIRPFPEQGLRSRPPIFSRSKFSLSARHADVVLRSTPSRPYEQSACHQFAAREVSEVLLLADPETETVSPFHSPSCLLALTSGLRRATEHRCGHRNRASLCFVPKWPALAYRGSFLGFACGRRCWHRARGAFFKCRSSFPGLPDTLSFVRFPAPKWKCPPSAFRQPDSPPPPQEWLCLVPPISCVTVLFAEVFPRTDAAAPHPLSNPIVSFPNPAP